MSSLAPNRQPAAMANAAVAADVHQPLDVHGDFGAQGAFDLDRPLDHLAEPGNFGVGQIPYPGIGTHTGLTKNAAAGGPTDSEDVGGRDLHPLLAWKVH